MLTDSGADPPREPSDEVLLLLNRATVLLHAVRTAAHDLNNALQMVGGSAEMLAGVPGLTPKSQARIETILRQVGRCHGIVQSIASLAHRDDPGPQELDLRAMVDAVVERRRYEHTRRNIDVTIEPPQASACVVRAGARDLHQALLDLIINAEQAVVGGASPAIRVAISRAADGFEVAVADNGPGLSRAAIDDVFKPFVSTRTGAAGLGLTAARMIVEQWGGTLRVDPAAEHGARFVLRLPAARRAQDTAVTSSPT